MLSYTTILSATLPVFLIMAVGFLFHQRKWLTEETEMGMMRLVMHFLFPCLILTLVPGNPGLATWKSAAFAISAGFFFVAAGVGISWMVGYAFGLRRSAGLRTFAISAAVQNYGFLALPIVIRLFPGNEGPAGLVFVHGVGVEIAMWTVGMVVLTGRFGLRSMVNGPFLSVMAALLLNYTGWYVHIPEVLQTSMDMMGRCAVPMSLLMIGATMATHFSGEMLTDALKVSAASIFVRLGLMALLILAVAKFAPFPPDLKRLLIVQAAMPAAVFPIVLARLYGGKPQIAIQVVLATSVVGIFTVPLVIRWGLAWLQP